MGHDKSKDAHTTTCALASELNKLRIPFEILTFSGPKNSHAGCVKTFDEPLNEKTKSTANGILEPRGYTPDFQALNIAVSRLHRHTTANRKVCIVITDGAGATLKDMAETTAKANRRGTQTVGIGIGEGHLVAGKYNAYAAVTGGKLDEKVFKTFLQTLEQTRPRK
jgi:hypothetical protein